ncbi:MAG: hypothetical protein WD065_03355 [Planctomycetaceae bacterium]
MVQSGFAMSGEGLQRFAFRALVGLGIALWAGLILQLKVETLGGAPSPHAAEFWTLTAIVNGDAAPTACINGCWVGIDDELPAHNSAAKILNIDRNEVLLSHDGERFVLRIHNRDVRWEMFEVTR